MTQLKPPTALERISGNVATESALTVVAALVGGPLAPLLPVLAKSLASERQKARLELAFMDINAALEEHGEQIRDLSDEQYKIINEAVLALLQTTQMGKHGEFVLKLAGVRVVSFSSFAGSRRLCGSSIRARASSPRWIEPVSGRF